MSDDAEFKFPDRRRRLRGRSRWLLAIGVWLVAIVVSFLDVPENCVYSFDALWAGGILISAVTLYACTVIARRRTWPDLIPWVCVAIAYAVVIQFAALPLRDEARLKANQVLVRTADQLRQRLADHGKAPLQLGDLIDEWGAGMPVNPFAMCRIHYQALDAESDFVLELETPSGCQMSARRGRTLNQCGEG